MQALNDLVKPSLNNIESASVAIVSLGYREKVLKQDGFGYLIPSDQKEDILGMIWDSSIFPQQNNHEQETRLTVMLGGTHKPGMVNLESSELTERALTACANHLGIDASPAAVHVTKAPYAIPQYYVGHAERLKSFENMLQNKTSRLTCFGTAFNGVAVNDCIAHAEHLVNNL